MFSFRSILLAVAAFATLTSATPMPANTEGDDIATDFSNLANTVKKGFTNAEAIINAVEMDTRGNSYTPADSFKKCSDGLTVIVVKISWCRFFFYHLSNRAELYNRVCYLL